jgi:hypothetical protein
LASRQSQLYAGELTVISMLSAITIIAVFLTTRAE